MWTVPVRSSTRPVSHTQFCPPSPCKTFIRGKNTVGLRRKGSKVFWSRPLGSPDILLFCLSLEPPPSGPSLGLSNDPYTTTRGTWWWGGEGTSETPSPLPEMRGGGVTGRNDSADPLNPIVYPPESRVLSVIQRIYTWTSRPTNELVPKYDSLFT